ncbi:hypothetical protein ARMSODRAFT_967085 [Armillaria solidipes]|uniref:Uncharacterized protein n=1 Tax=Armillaria solidipes TaxID=1076256 RepID=A0A2H3AR64_9AGAR|nr:hypothetical protein ARMSODRAFT_967085 [Armillaria solidipes]
MTTAISDSSASYNSERVDNKSFPMFAMALQKQSMRSSPCLAFSYCDRTAFATTATPSSVYPFHLDP